MLSHLDLFSGIGGFSLGLESAGVAKTVAFCDFDDYCQQVLKKNFPKISRKTILFYLVSIDLMKIKLGITIL